jgi:predicted RNase H-like HicB family nuclease
MGLWGSVEKKAPNVGALSRLVIGLTQSHRSKWKFRLKIKVVVHEAEEGGYWGEVPSISGCTTQGETFEELLKTLYEAVEGCLSVDISTPKASAKARAFEIIV